MNAHPLSIKAATAVLALGAWLALLAACGGQAEAPGQTPEAGETPSPGGDATAFSLVSEAFGNDETIPALYTCDGDNVSPALAWSGVPEGTQSFALITDDPDAPGGTFTHWVLYNIRTTAPSLPEGVETVPMPAYGLEGFQGSNDAGGIGYTGPCPPPGDPHRYRFTLYALDQTVELEPGASKQQLLDAIEGHVLAEAELAGLYGR